MDATPMPEPLRRAVHQLVPETVMNCQEVLRYTEPDRALDWKRMTLYRATDGADTLDMASLLIAAYLRHTGTSMETRGVPADPPAAQPGGRASGARPGSDSRLAGRVRAPWRRAFAGDPVGQIYAEDALTPEDDPQRLFTEACLHGLRAKLCDEVDTLDNHLPPQVAAMARKVADASKCLSRPLRNGAAGSTGTSAKAPHPP